MNPEESLFRLIAKHPAWTEQLVLLDELARRSGLKAEVKWGMPTFTEDGTNVVGIGAFKAYVGIWFFQGALLSDPEGVLVNAQEGKTKAMRQWRFAAGERIPRKKLLAYLREARILAAEGKAVPAARTRKPLVLPEELRTAMEQDPHLQSAFDALPLSQRREHADHIAEAKRPETRQRRLAKCSAMILAGQGLHDKYR